MPSFIDLFWNITLFPYTVTLTMVPVSLYSRVANVIKLAYK